MELAIQNVPEEYKALYRAHYKTIRTRVTQGRIKTVYHFLVTGTYTRETAKNYLPDLEFGGFRRYKINASFGFILKNIETDEYKFFYPSNNCMIYDLPQSVSNKPEFKKLLDDLEREDALAYAMANRPSTKWQIAKIVCVRFDVYKAAAPTL